MSHYNKEWNKWPLIVFLFLNIAEAMVFDLQNNNYFNVVLGALLIFFFPYKARLFSENEKVKFNINLYWVLTYTFWNLSFVANLFGGKYIAQHLVVLSFPLILAYYKGIDYWIYYRVLSLGFYFILFNTFFRFFEDSYLSSTIYNVEISYASTFIGIFTLLYAYIKIKKDNKERLLR